MEKHMAERRVSVTLSKKKTGSANRTYHPSDEVMVFREKFNNVELHKWIGPFKVIQQTGKNLEVQHTNPWAVKIFKYHIDQVKPFCIDHTPDSQSEAMPAILDTDENGNPLQIQITELLSPEDNRSNNSEFIEAKHKEIQGLIEKGMFKVCLKTDVPEHANILGLRFVLTIKNKDTDHEIYKARLVVQGHKDAEKDMIINKVSSLHKRGVRLLASMAATFD